MTDFPAQGQTTPWRDQLKAYMDERFGVDVGQAQPGVWAIGRRRLFVGDSITNGSSAAGFDDFYVTLTQTFSGNEINLALRQGFPGERSDEVVARLADLIVANSPDSVHLQVGTNDAGQNRTPAQFMASVQAAKVICDEAGLPMSVGTVPPRGSAFASHSLIAAYNIALNDWCARHNVPLAQTHAALVDTATGYLAAAYDSGDAVHPNSAGHKQMALAILPVIAQMARRTPWPIMSKQPGNLLPNPLNVTATGGWAIVAGSAGAGTYEARTNDLTAGQWRQNAIDNTAGGSQINYTVGQPIDMTGVSVGDVLRIYSKIEAVVTGAARVHAQLSRGAANVTRPATNLDRTPLSGLVADYTVQPADIGATMSWGYSLAVPAGATATVRMGQMGVFNRTKLGLL